MKLKRIPQTGILVLLLSFSTLLLAQRSGSDRPVNPNKDICVKKDQVFILPAGTKPMVIPSANTKTPTEETIGETVYDLQTNSTAQKRIYVYDDGTIGATWIHGTQSSNGYPDRGAGYNYYNGASWGPYPNYRVESVRTGWPAYAPLGDSGEIICAHSGTTSGLVISLRDQRGSGNWTQFTLAGPTGNPNILWPRMVTSGKNHDTIHIIALTAPVANAGSIYNGLDGALLYYRSTNGGTTFDQTHVQPTGLTSANYKAFGGDRYAWANPVGDTLAFVLGDNWYDLVLCKSTDGGNSWSRQVVFQHPYPMFEEPTTLVLDTPWVCDGALAVALDKHGDAHLCFGLMRVLNDDLVDGSTSYFPFTDGLVYWKEGEAPFSTLDIDSVEARGNLVAWMQDLNQNGSLDFISTATTALGLYYMSITSMPQIHVDMDDNIFVVYSSVQEDAHNGVQNYRRIWGRGKIGSVNSWDTMFNITSSIAHNFNECIFPSINPSFAPEIHITFQVDSEPGLSVRGDEDPPALNGIKHASIPKNDFLMTVGKNPERMIRTMSISQNYPNPFSSTSRFRLYSADNKLVLLSVRNLLGKVVFTKEIQLPGGKEIEYTLDRSDWGAGIYFYTVSDGEQQLTRKMVVSSQQL